VITSLENIVGEKPEDISSIPIDKKKASRPAPSDD
jgi:hypothetical protein